MLQSSTTTTSCLYLFSPASLYNKLTRSTSTNISTSTRLTRLLAQLSATGLVVASAGLGAIYAWSAGSEHGIALAGLMVLMAVALEVAKPLSFAAAFKAFRSWSLVSGLSLLALASVAIVYSLTAELTLMAGARGDLVAQRAAVIHTSASAEVEAQRMRDRYEGAKTELATLPVTRPAAELKAEIDGLLMTPGANGCAKIDGKITRDVCPKVATLRGEMARAERRSELEGIIALPLATTTTAISAPTDQREVKDADPGASALATYLAALGFVIKVDVLTEWLALIPVLALEIGSALAGVLVQSFSGVTTTRARRKDEEVSENELAPQGVVHVAQSRNVETSEECATAREKVKVAIVDQLKANGGSTSSSERGLAKLIGASRPTVRRALNGLVIAGVIAAEATRNGTALRLVA